MHVAESLEILHHPLPLGIIAVTCINARHTSLGKIDTSQQAHHPGGCFFPTCERHPSGGKLGSAAHQSHLACEIKRVERSNNEAHWGVVPVDVSIEEAAGLALPQQLCLRNGHALRL
jgi:hypothetical protein